MLRFPVCLLATPEEEGACENAGEHERVYRGWRRWWGELGEQRQVEHGPLAAGLGRCEVVRSVKNLCQVSLKTNIPPRPTNSLLERESGDSTYECTRHTHLNVANDIAGDRGCPRRAGACAPSQDKPEPHKLQQYISNDHSQSQCLQEARHFGGQVGNLVTAVALLHRDSGSGTFLGPPARDLDKILQSVVTASDLWTQC